jgi:Uma2 family endonuclease
MPTQLPVAETTQTMPAEQRLTLTNISWDTYDKLLDAFGEHRAVRLHYDEGVLEFMVPLEAHENPSDVLGALIFNLAVDCGLTIKSMASTTLRRQPLQKGAEPDKCFYIQNEPLVRGKTVDLETDPPPDLVVEVDITHSDINKNALYARLGIPEFWRFNGKTLRIFQLQDGSYQEVNVSPTFPWLNKQVIYNFLEQCRTLGEAQAMRNFRTWLHEHKPS